MLTKIYQLLYTFSVEYLSGLAFKPQTNEITWRLLSNWWYKCEQSDTRPTELCSNVEHPLL